MNEKELCKLNNIYENYKDLYSQTTKEIINLYSQLIFEGFNSKDDLPVFVLFDNKLRLAYYGIEITGENVIKLMRKNGKITPIDFGFNKKLNNESNT